MLRSALFRHESHRTRDRWPYPAMLPHSIKAYPIVQVAPEIGPQLPSQWPPPMPADVAAWRDEHSYYPNVGNQIYVHVPFCPFLCHFCPLYKVKKSELRTLDTKEHFVQTLIKEIEMYSRIPSVGGKQFNSIYIGGGTPTELTPKQLGRILDALRKNLSVTSDCEITLEGVAKQMLAPGFMSEAFDYGFNRVSFGVQTLDIEQRRRIGRGDQVRDYPALIKLVRDLNPKAVVNCEIMAGLPEQTFESFELDVRELISWETNSLDVLYYIHMPGTQLYQLVQKNKRKAPEFGERLLELRKFTNQTFHDAGFSMATGEVFVKNERDLFVHTGFGGGGHGLNALLAVGPSGFGQLNGTVYQNICDLELWTEAVESGRLGVVRAKTMDQPTAERRALLLSILRLEIPDFLVKGVRNRIHVHRWEKEGLIERDLGRYRLTDRGKLWYNHLQVDTLPLPELFQTLRMFGSIEDQDRALSGREEEMGSQEREVRELVKAQFRLGAATNIMHRAFLKAHKLKFFDRRAIGFSGPVEQAN